VTPLGLGRHAQLPVLFKGSQMIARIAAALLIAGLAPGSHPEPQREVIDVNSPVQTVWGVSELEYRLVDGGVEVACLIHHRGEATPGMTLVLTLGDQSGGTLASARVQDFSDRREDRLTQFLTLSPEALLRLKEIRAELVEYDRDGSRARMWSGVVRKIAG
jgi:hypothetical protein